METHYRFLLVDRSSRAVKALQSAGVRRSHPLTRRVLECFPIGFSHFGKHGNGKLFAGIGIAGVMKAGPFAVFGNPSGDLEKLDTKFVIVNDGRKGFGDEEILQSVSTRVCWKPWDVNERPKPGSICDGLGRMNFFL